MHARPLAPLVLLVAGCDRHYELYDPGEVCFQLPIADGEPLEFRVILDCVSSSRLDEVWTCALPVMSANTIAIEATYAYDMPRGGGSADCGYTSTTCTSEPLSAGTWTATYGLNAATFVVGGGDPTWICMIADESSPTFAELATDPW